MNKIFIASDIHGSAFYCSQMLAAYDREKADKMVLLGDILYHGPRNDLPEEYAPKKVMAMLNERKQDIICVRGNCDTEVDQMVLEFNVMSEQGIIYADGIRLVLAHGHKLSGVTKPVMCSGDVLLCGHTHVPAVKKIAVNENDESEGYYTYINPGSVSIPKENSWHGYIIYENGTFTMKDFDGNVKDTITINGL